MEASVGEGLPGTLDGDSKGTVTGKSRTRVARSGRTRLRTPGVLPVLSWRDRALGLVAAGMLAVMLYISAVVTSGA